MTNEDILLKIEAQKKRDALMRTATPSAQRANMFSDVSYTTGFNQLYDKTLSGNYEMKFKNYLGLEGNEDRLAKQQTAWEQVSNGLWKNLGKTGLYVGDAVNTVTYGLYSAIKDRSLQSLWDNDVSNYLDDEAKKLDRDFANYYTDEEKSKGFFGRMFTNPANFFANDVAGGLAFIGGAVIPELALGVLSGGTTLPTSLAKMSAKMGLKTAFKSADNIAGTVVKEGIEQATEQAVKQATRKNFKDGFSALLRSNTGKKVGEVANFGRFIGQSTFFEAGMEARHSFHDSIDTYMRDFQAREGRLPSQDELTTYIGEAGKAANFVFGANVGLLSVTNAAMFGKMFGLKPLNLETKIGKTFGINVSKLADGKLAMTTASKAQKVGGNLYYLGKKPFSEGVVEEGLQGVFGKTMDNYLKAKYDPNQSDVSLMNAFGEAMKEQYTTNEGWFEIGIGAMIGMIGGNVSGDFGIEGVGKKGYSGARKSLEANVEVYNDATTKALKNVMRTNSISNYNIGKETGVESTPAFQDTVVNFNYIKANEALKGYVNTKEDFNTAVDAMTFTPEQMQSFGFKTEEYLNGYKSSLKDNFAKDYDIYQEVDTIVKNLDVPVTSEGELSEFRDAVMFSLMAGKKAGVESEKIAQNIAKIAGIDGLYDAMKFSQEMDENFDTNIQTLKEKESRLEEFKKEIVNIGAKLQESKGNESLYKENTKKHLLLTQEILKLENETQQLETVLENDFKAMQANITFTPQEMSTIGIKDIMDKMSEIENYIGALEKTGRTAEAKNLKTLLTQFNLYTSAEINAVDTIRRMSDTNFYSSKEGKSLLGKIRGEDYKMSDIAKKEIEENSELFRDILVKNGFEDSNVAEAIESRIASLGSLSEREKYKFESMFRATLAYKRIQDSVEDAQEEFENAEKAVIEDFAQEGDTIAIRKKLQGTDMNNPESINQLIKDITGEIDTIVNKPTAEALREIKAKQKQIEQLRDQLKQIQDANQKQSTESLPMGNESQTSGEVREGNTQEQEVTQESEEEVTDEDYNNFVDNGVVSNEIIDSIANKVKDNLPLTERELAIFTDKTAEVNQRIVEINTESEFGSPEMAEKIKEQIDSLTQEEIDEVITEIEQEDDTTRENGTDIGGETNTNADGKSRQDAQSETVETTQTVDATSNVEDQIQEITKSIQQLEEEISDLKTPFKFMDSEGYIRYNKLLEKRIKEGQLSPQEEQELTELEGSINQWITISGVRVQGIELSDLIRQLQAFENTVVINPGGGTREVEEEEIDEDARQSEDSVNNNYDVGLSYNGVVSRRTKDSTVISNISLETLEEASGVPLKGREGVSIGETGGLKLSNEIVKEINEKGNVVILNPAYDEVSSYYSLVLQSVPNPVTGVTELYPIQSDYDYVRDDKGKIARDENGDPIIYEDGAISSETIYNTTKEETVLMKIDPNHPYNKELLEELRAEMGVNKPLTEEEFKIEVEKIVQEKASKNKTIEKTQSEISELQAKDVTTTTKARLNTLEKRLKEQLQEIRDKAQEEVEKRKEKKPKKPNAKLIEKIISKLRIVAVNEAGENLQILKGIRTGEGFEGTNPHFEALRIKLASDPQALLDLIESNNFETYDLGVTVSKIFMGLPNYNYTRNADGTVSRQHKSIIKEDLSKIEDIGYVSEGELHLRSGKTDNVNTDFIKTPLNKKSKDKHPVVIIRKGEHLIAFPVRVARDESPINLDTFKTIFESDSISAVDKAMRLNTMLAQAGMDVKQKGQSFVVIGDNVLNEEFFNNIFAQLKEKEYIRSVDSWTDPKTSIESSLLDNAKISIRLSDPFISPKIKFDFSKVEVEEIPETKKNSTKKTVVDNKQSVLKKFRCK